MSDLSTKNRFAMTIDPIEMQSRATKRGSNCQREPFRYSAMRRRQFLVTFFCVCVLVFCPYAIFTSYFSTPPIPTSERLSRTLIHKVMNLTIDGGGYRNLVFDYPVVDDGVDPSYVPTIPDTEVMVNATSGRRLKFEDLVELDPALIRFQHSKGIYHLFPLHVNMSQIFRNMSRMLPISQVSLCLSESFVFNVQKWHTNKCLQKLFIYKSCSYFSQCREHC